MITGHVKQGEKEFDPYAEPIAVDQPVEFLKGERVVQKLRTVEAYVVDEQGNRIMPEKPWEEQPIRTAQLWRLVKDAPGMAEMSAILGDMVNAVEGDMVIDPSTVFNPSYQDTRISKTNPTTVFGSNEIVEWSIGLNYDDRLLFTFDLSNSLIAESIINYATLEFYEISQTWTSPNARAQLFKINTEWTQSTATWQYPWGAAGGDFNSTAYKSSEVILPATSGNWIRMDATQALKSLMRESSNGYYYVSRKGFLVKGNLSTIGSYQVAMKEYTPDTSKRPRLVIEYSGTQFGAGAGYPYDQPAGWEVDVRQDKMKEDKLNIIRYSGQRVDFETDAVTIANGKYFVQTAHGNGMKVILVFPAGWTGVNGFVSKEDYASYIENFLVALSSPVNYITNGTLLGIEIGAEEDDTSVQKWTKVLDNGYYLATSTGGGEFAQYYLAAWDKIKSNPNHPEWRKLWVMSGSIEDWKWVTRTDQIKHSKAFLTGFLDAVTTSQNLHKAPDMIAMHSYTGQYSQLGSGGDWNEFHSINKVLFDMCNSRGFIPNIVQTEYGYSATHPESLPGITSPWAPLNKADNITQAVYYLQSRLIHAGMNPNFGFGMSLSTYFLHPRSIAGGVIDIASRITEWGFHNFDTSSPPYPGSDRAIRSVSRILMNPTENIYLGDPNLKVWISTRTTPGNPPTVRTAWCGFKQNDDFLWLAVWKYKNEDNYYEDAVGSTVIVSATGDYRNHTPTAYKFNISQGTKYYIQEKGYSLPSRTGSATFSPTTLQTFNRYYSYLYNTTDFEISPVNENPVFIRLAR